MKKLIWLILATILLTGCYLTSPFVNGAFSADLSTGVSAISTPVTAQLMPDQIRIGWKVAGRDFVKLPMTNAETITLLIAEDALLDSQIAAITADPNAEVSRITTYLTGQAASVVLAIQFRTQEAKIKTEIVANPAEYIKQRLATLKSYKVMVEAHLAKLRGVK